MKLYSIEAGNFKLDGGAMFSVVPKSLWEKTNPADKNNLIEMSSRCLLIEDGKRLILIDTGLGDKQNARFFSRYALWGEYSLDSSLKKAGFHRDDITDVFLTHLHFDHCGGAISRSRTGALVPSFKNAVFWIHRSHWEWATKPNQRESASFLKENIIPIKDSGQLKFIDGTKYFLDKTPFPFSNILVDGHTEKQMLPVIKINRKTIIFAGDLIPTIGHLPIPYIMSYDTRPLLTLKEKKLFLEDAVLNETLLFMEHDPFHELISLKTTDKGVRMNTHYKLSSYFSNKH